MKLAYGEKQLVASGPVYMSHKISKDHILIHFDPATVGDGLVSLDGEPLDHFAVAGEDEVFHWAKATIVGNSIEVTCDAVPDPKFVRYAWADNPDFANLGNKAGLPASPFRSK